VEPIFQTLKRRFRILRAPQEYTYATQVKLVFALTALHNFIRINNDKSELDRWRRSTSVEMEVEIHDGESSQENAETDTASVEEETEAVEGNGGRQMAELRDQIAEEMWRDYTGEGRLKRKRNLTGKGREGHKKVCS
ncbi:hypothetical protein BZA05DRAFT_337688, partial [Tricharina praecox]|uniref:uncharacterized protein n=1 Tax=Tricharina praecox TaxID=43433 RepID=UPI00221E3CAF